MGRLPVGQSIGRILPIGNGPAHIDLFASAQGIVAWHTLTQRGVAGILDASPRAIGAEHFRLPLSHQDESRLDSSIGHRLIGTFAPYLGSHHILAFPKIAGNVEGLVVPMLRIVASWTKRGQDTVDIELVALVGGNMDLELGGHGSEVDVLTEIIDAIGIAIGIRHFDPGCTPLLLEHVELRALLSSLQQLLNRNAPLGTGRKDGSEQQGYEKMLAHVN